jgi:tetratricopeptide (TPR) repeat protein
MLSQFNFDDCERVIAGIQEVDDSSIDGELLLCRDLLQERRPREAVLPVQRILARQPHHLEALGLLAAAQALQLHEQEMIATLKQVDQIDPTNASAYLEVAQQLAARRQYPRSAEMYKIAIQRAPWWTEAYNGLGLLYTQSGDEEASFDILQKARVLDPYNVATTNYLRLLDDFHKFAKKETEHFIIYYDADKDPVIPEYFGDYLESIYPAVCAEYHTQPKAKTSIEGFPTHAQFSVRTTGSPWIGTVGASTGSIIALVAPRKGSQTMGSFNWAQVLRHEFTHTVTLAATDNRIEHWMTEGLAVMEEHAPIHWEWVPMLYQAVKTHRLFTMDNLTWGFIRPKKPEDRALAYAESFWICTYIEATYGHDKILAMLDQFKLGKEQDEVFPMILGKSMDQFQADFFAWCDQQVASWGYDKATSIKYQNLATAGDAQIKNRNYQAAVKTWEQIVKLRPVDSMPHMRLAGLYLKLDQQQQAIEQLDILDKVTVFDNQYALRMGGIYRDMKDMDKAVYYAQRAVYIDPYDLRAHKLLVEILETTATDPKNLEREKRVIGILEAQKTRQAAEKAKTPVDDSSGN